MGRGGKSFSAVHSIPQGEISFCHQTINLDYGMFSLPTWLALITILAGIYTLAPQLFEWSNWKWWWQINKEKIHNTSKQCNLFWKSINTRNADTITRARDKPIELISSFFISSTFLIVFLCMQYVKTKLLGMESTSYTTQRHINIVEVEVYKEFQACRTSVLRHE